MSMPFLAHPDYQGLRPQSSHFSVSSYQHLPPQPRTRLNDPALVVPQLPLEIIDIITHKIVERGGWHDVGTLRAIAETCKAWKPIGQQYLFRRVRGRLHRIMRIEEEVWMEGKAGKDEVSRLFGHTRKLEIYGQEPDNYPLATISSLLACFPNLQAFWLDTFPFTSGPAAIQLLALDHVKLSYYDYATSAFLDFVAFLNLFSGIRQLDVSEAEFSEDFGFESALEAAQRFIQQRGADALTLGIQIEELSIRGSGSTASVAIIELLRMNPSTAKSLTRVAVDTDELDQIIALCDLLQVAENVEEVDFEVREEVDDAWLPTWNETIQKLSSTSLRSLKLRVSMMDDPDVTKPHLLIWTRVVSMISHLPPTISYIHLELQGLIDSFLTQFRACEGMKGPPLDDVLGGLANLRTFRVKMEFERSVNLSSPIELLQRALKKTADRELLVVE
ncbi:hypothetical protein BXZ70DRAFT_1003138 [Cristinia sonorae]|uniref:Uncharacterized protein n=1 Tax=Cristinia sonorae TaxID=1940300 RepID=A0A8K0UZE2_9AGAR|nr:hypothetical protein BXZ70DRAFT_1003138 [Cristinia sonorae]